MLALEQDIGRSKVKLANRYVKQGSGFTVVGHETRWQALPTSTMENVSIALDSATDRRASSLEDQLLDAARRSWSVAS